MPYKEVFLVLNASTNAIEIKDFGVIIDPSTFYDFRRWEETLLSTEVDSYLQSGDFVRYLNNKPLPYSEAFTKIEQSNTAFNGNLEFDSSALLPDVSLATNPTNNLSIPNLNLASVAKISSAGNLDLTGIVAPTNGLGPLIWFINTGPGDIKFKYNDIRSVAANRFLHGNGDDITVKKNGGAMLYFYDTTASRWRSLGYFG